MNKFVAAALGALLAAGNAHAGDAQSGQEKSKTCAACHGADGNSVSPDFPRLAGQHADYLLHALLDYKAGRRANPIMAGQVANLSKEDFGDLAAYFSSQKGLYDKR